MNIKSSEASLSRDSRRTRKHALAVAIALGLAIVGSSALATDRDKAKRIHDRITGVPPSDSVLNQMEALVTAGDPVGAANIAMNNSAFYNVTLKNMTAPLTNRDHDPFVPLNDYTATVIGMVRDNVPFNTLLSADILYVGNGVTPAYSPNNNDHYLAMENSNTDLQAALVQTTQSGLTGVPAGATAGIITTRAAAQAFFINGTNRAMFRFTMLNHLCHDMETVHDTTRPTDRIRQDVTRSPGGDSRIFLNNCVGCHSGMDPMAQAFAYYNFDSTAGAIQYTPGQVQPKYTINSDNFKPGFVTLNDNWENRWRVGPNSKLGISPLDPAPPASGWSAALPGSGAGAKSLGVELGNSEAFAACQVEKVFEHVCFRAVTDTADRTKVNDIVKSFKSHNYNLKQVFAETAAYCMGQ